MVHPKGRTPLWSGMNILMSQHVISIREIIAIALTMAERTDFVDRPAPVDVLRPSTAEMGRF